MYLYCLYDEPCYEPFEVDIKIIIIYLLYDNMFDDNNVNSINTVDTATYYFISRWSKSTKWLGGVVVDRSKCINE